MKLISIHTILFYSEIQSVAQAAELARVKEKEWKEKYGARRTRSANGRLKTAKERPAPSGRKAKPPNSGKAPSTADPDAVRPQMSPDFDEIPDLDEVLPPGHSFLSAVSTRGAPRGPQQSQTRGAPGGRFPPPPRQ